MRHRFTHRARHLRRVLVVRFGFWLTRWNRAAS